MKAGGVVRHSAALTVLGTLVLLALSALVIVPLASAQPVQAGSGEASLKVPDLGQPIFMVLDGRMILKW